MENKKGNKGLVVTLIIIIVLLLGCLGFGGYKYMSLQKDNDKLRDENKSISEEINRQNAQSGQVSTTNDYSLFVKQLKETRSKMTYVDEYDKKTYKQSFIEDTQNFRVEKLGPYQVELTNDGVLKVVPLNGSRKITEIAKNVLFYKIVSVGNGGFRGLFYVTEEGKAYFTSVETALLYNEEIKSKQIKGVANVVNILPLGQSAAFVDINGNIIEESN